MKYRYYINDVEVFPKGEWVINYQRNEGQIFFRRIFEGELTFFNDDYNFIMGLDCEIATFDIYCGGAIHWEGQFQYPYKVKFDDDSCVAVITPEVVDEYSCIMDNYETEYPYALGVGGVVPELWTCPAPGAQLAILPTAFRLGVPGGGSIFTGHLNTIINYSANLDCGIDLRSSFLWRDNYANGDAYVGTDNYITGATNRLEYIYFIRNRSLRVSFGGTGCDGFLQLTFKMYEDLLRNAFNAYWFIDENGDFRIEHIYYFDPAFPHSDYTVGHDLNTVMDRGGRSFAYRRNKYEYETGRLYDREIWTWQHYEGTEGGGVHSADFDGVPIFYGPLIGQKSDYVPGDFKEKEHASPKFWTDIFWGQGLAGGLPDTIKCNGLCMLDVITTAPNNKINCEVGILSGVSRANTHLSTANLQNHYHQYDRIFINGNMNSGDVLTFQTAQKHKLQDPIEFPLCCDDTFDPLNRIRTGLGDGRVKAAVQKKQSLEVELWHDFDCSGLCILEGCINWDGIDDRVSLDITPAIQITGTRTIKFESYLFYDTGAGNYPMFAFQGTTDDYFAVYYSPSQDLLMTRCDQSGAGTGRNWELSPSHYNKCISVVFEKTAGVVVSCEIDGVALSHDGTTPSLTMPTSSDIGFYGGQAGYLTLAAIWDIQILTSAPAVLHHWRGYPAGNLDPAWLDLGAAADGTVTGTPAIY